MKQFGLDTDRYHFVISKEDDGVEYEYKHKFLVPGTEDESSNDPNMWLGPEEKWGNWTKLNALQFAKKHNLRIIQTRKKPAKRRKK